MTFQFKKKKKLCKGLCRKSSLCIKLMFVCDYMQMSSTKKYLQNGVKINKAKHRYETFCNSNLVILLVFKVYMTDFLICSIKLPQCTDKNSKTNILIAIFLAGVLMYQKRQISLLLGYKTSRPKTGDWEWLWRHFRTWSFAKNRFLRHFLILL